MTNIETKTYYDSRRVFLVNSLESESEEHSLMWSMLFPLIAFSLHGTKAGLLVSLFFYTIVFSVAATNVGNWDNGNWDTQDLIQFILASSTLTALIFLSETSLEQQQLKKNDKLFFPA